MKTLFSQLINIRWIAMISLLIMGTVSNHPVLAQAISANDVYAVAWSPDGSKIAGAGRSGFLRIWNASGQTLLTLTGVSTDVFTVAWSPDSTKIVSGSDDKNLRIWNASTGQLLATLSGHEDIIQSVAWSPDGSKIASASFEELNALRTWNATTYQPLTIDTISNLFTVHWRPDSNLLAVTAGYGGINFYSPDLSNWTRIANSNDVSLAGLSWNNDGSRLVTSNSDTNLTIWDAVTGQAIRTLTGHTKRVNAVSWNNGQQIASSSIDGTVRVWDANSGQEIRRYSRPPSLNTAIAWSPDGTRLAFGSTNGELRIENVFRSGTGLRGQYFNNADLTVPVFFRLNSTVNFSWGTGTPDTAIAADTFSVRWTGKVEPLYSESYTFYVAHNDGARLWVNGQQIINNWGTRTTEAETASTPITLAAGVKYDLVLEYTENTGSASVKLWWSSSSQAKQIIPAAQLYPPEGQLAFTRRIGSSDSVYVYNPDGSSVIQVFGKGAAWSPDGTRVAYVSTIDGNEEIYVANADGSGVPRRLTNHTATDNEIAWSPDSTKIAFTSRRTGNGDIYVMTVGTSGIPTPTRLTTSTNYEYLPSWSPNGARISYVQDVGTNPEIYLMNANGTSPIRLTNRAGIDSAPFWSPDGSKIAIRATLSGQTNIWVITISPLSVAQITSSGQDYFQSWSPDGSKILFLSARDGNAEIYTMNADGTAQTRLTDTTTSESYAVWSADARQIAFVRSGDIWFMNADGSGAFNFTNTPTQTESEIVWWQPKQTI